MADLLHAILYATKPWGYDEDNLKGLARAARSSIAGPNSRPMEFMHNGEPQARTATEIQHLFDSVRGTGCSASLVGVSVLAVSVLAVAGSRQALARLDKTTVTLRLVKS